MCGHLRRRSNSEMGKIDLRYAILILVALAVGACQTAGTSSSPRAASTAAQRMVRTELVFGAGRENAANVSDWAWQTFVDREITPRFPDGMTFVPANGQW